MQKRQSFRRGRMCTVSPLALCKISEWLLLAKVKQNAAKVQTLLSYTLTDPYHGEGQAHGKRPS
jgi:hypothetical protein